MTKGEWSQLSYLTLGEWWDSPQDEEREAAWFDQLQHYERDDVYRVFEALLRDSPRFAPRLGEVLTRLEPMLPAFDEAWPLIAVVLRNASVYGEQGTVSRIADRAGPVVAGWVASYGAVRLAREPVFDPEFGGAVLKRLAESYDGLVGTAQGRQAAVERTQRAARELEREEQRVLTSGVGWPD